MANSVDPDQSASLERQGISGFSRTRVNSGVQSWDWVQFDQLTILYALGTNSHTLDTLTT